nr:hypothetical protein [Tanacetum cinerariifolium]
MVTILAKSDVAEGFEQIIDFLSGSYIYYAFTVNPHIYILCIKQFWNTALVKHSDDVTRLQALVDRKKSMISEDVIHEILEIAEEGIAEEQVQADDVVAAAVQEIVAEDVANEAIPSTLTPLILPSPPSHDIPSTSQNQIGDLSTHTTRYISLALTQKVFANIRRVRKGISGVETPLFKGMLAVREIAEEGIAEEQVQADDVVAAAVQEIVAEDVANEAIPSTLTPLILPSPPSHDIPSTSQVQSLPPQQ